jgi:hypothetical protein
MSIYIYIVLMWASEHTYACICRYNVLSLVGGVRVAMLTGSDRMIEFIGSWVTVSFNYN